MAKSVEVAAKAASPITGDQLERVSKFTREPILLDGETFEDLAPGTARRRAVEAALAELDAGLETPSPEWRRRYSLLLGLERLLDTEPVLLADGAELTEHQVDVLSGTLAALTTEVENSAPEGWNGAGPSETATGPKRTPRRTRRWRRTRRSPRTGRSRPPRSSPRRPRIRGQAAGSGSSTPPARARPSPRLGSSRRREPAGC
jgi:hypothetical protein